MTTESPKRRRWFQFRLRTLLIVVLVLSLPLSWFAVRMERARRQREAVEAIENALGWVTYEPAVPTAPDWARNVLGDDFFVDVVEVRSGLNAFYDDPTVYTMPNTERLSNTAPPVTDAWLEHITALTSLKKLYITGRTRITDVGLANLKGLTGLEELTIGRSKITDTGLANLRGLTKIKSLTLSFSEITDAGLCNFKGLTRLETLGLTGLQVNGPGLDHLKGLTSLKSLDLDSSEGVDAELEHLSGLISLKSLSLRKAQITDEGLEHLKALTNLRKLDIAFNRVTQQGVDNLRLALPNCEIRYSVPRRRQEEDPIRTIRTAMPLRRPSI